MKRLAVMICLLLCLMIAAESALAATSSAAEYLGDMQVVNCKQWVSLRRTPSTEAKRLATVPLGSIVTNCHSASNGFVQCDYMGQTGFILEKYLRRLDIPVPTAAPQTQTQPTAAPTQKTNKAPAKGSVGEDTSRQGELGTKMGAAPTPYVAPAPVPTAAPTIAPTLAPSPSPAVSLPPELMPYAENIILATEEPAAEPTPEPLPEPMGDLILDGVSGTQVKAYRKLDGVNETVTIQGIDTDGQIVWEYQTAAAQRENGNAITVFLDGANLPNFVFVYNADEGLSMLFFGDTAWTIPLEKLTLNGDVIYAVGPFSNIYVGGSEGTDPVAIDLSGQIVWRSNSEGCTGLYMIIADEFGLICQYTAIDGDPEADGVVFFGLDGALQDKGGGSNGMGAEM